MLVTRIFPPNLSIIVLTIENLKLIDSKLEIYSSSNAAEIITELRRIVEDEKLENGLPSCYTKINNEK